MSRFYSCVLIFSQSKDIKNTSTELFLVSHCPYRMAIKAKAVGGETPWSEEKHFGMVILPLVSCYSACWRASPQTAQQLKARVLHILLPSSGYFKNRQATDKNAFYPPQVMCVCFFCFLFFSPLLKHWVEIVITLMLLMCLHADAETDPYTFLYAAIIIPLMFAGLAALTLACCWKYVKSFYIFC